MTIKWDITGKKSMSDLTYINNVVYPRFGLPLKPRLEHCLEDSTLEDLEEVCGVLVKVGHIRDLNCDSEDEYRLLLLADICEKFLEEFARIDGDSINEVKGDDNEE